MWGPFFYEKESDECIKCQKEEDARFSCSHGNQRGKSGPEQEKGKRQKETCGVITDQGGKRQTACFKGAFRMSRNTLRKHEKVRRNKEYLTIYGEGVRRYSGNFTVIAHSRLSGPTRLGITVGKKAGNAVRRNRIKRLLREYFRLNKMRLSEAQDIVIIAKKNIPHLSYRDVCKELECLVIDKANKT